MLHLLEIEGYTNNIIYRDSDLTMPLNTNWYNGATEALLYNIENVLNLYSIQFPATLGTFLYGKVSYKKKKKL